MQYLLHPTKMLLGRRAACGLRLVNTSLGLSPASAHIIRYSSIVLAFCSDHAKNTRMQLSGQVLSDVLPIVVSHLVALKPMRASILVRQLWPEYTDESRFVRNTFPEHRSKWMMLVDSHYVQDFVDESDDLSDATLRSLLPMIQEDMFHSMMIDLMEIYNYKYCNYTMPMLDQDVQDRIDIIISLIISLRNDIVRSMYPSLYPIVAALMKSVPFGNYRQDPIARQRIIDLACLWLRKTHNIHLLCPTHQTTH